MPYKSRKKSAYGINNPLQKLNPLPIIGQRDPTTSDFHEIGTLWINETTNRTFIITSVSSGSANWEQSSGNELKPPVKIGDSTTREGAHAADWSSEGNIFQVYADDAAATGANYRKAGRFDLTASSGDGTDSPQALRGNMRALTGAHHEEIYGGYFWAQQDDGSQIDSNIIGLVAAANSLETDAGDLPQQWAYGIQGILFGSDTAAAYTAGLQAGVASYVTYNTSLNAVGYGFIASRNGGGAGVTAAAAYKVEAGSAIVSDWEYGLDLYNGATGLAYNTSDIRLWNESTITSDGEGALFSGDIDGRAIVATNTRMRPYQGPVMSTKANTGGAATGATGDENLMSMQQGEIMEQHILGAGQTIIAPRMEADGLLISLDLTNNEGAEYSWGFLSSNKHAFTIGTDAAFYFECQLKLADATGCDPVYIGFRKQEAYQAAFTNYTDFALIGVEESQNSETITIADRLNSGGITYTNTTDAWTDGQTHTLRVLVDASGNVTYTIDGAAPTATHALQFDNGDVVMPCIYFLHGAGAPGKIHLISMEAGYQAWN